VTDESTKIVVLKEANGMFRSSTSLAHNSGFTERSVKYIANKAAKNINSLASQTMVPIDTIFGRSAWLGTLIAVAVLTP
jgi:pantoate kinase